MRERYKIEENQGKATQPVQINAFATAEDVEKGRRSLCPIFPPHSVFLMCVFVAGSAEVSRVVVIGGQLTHLDLLQAESESCSNQPGL